MNMRKPSTIALLILASLLVAAGAFCLDYFVLSAPAENTAAQPSSILLLSIAPTDQTGLVFDEPEVDLGAAKNAVAHRFTYRNAGTKPLTITKVRPSCSCVVSDPDRTTLQPGESGSITFEVDVSRKEPGAHRFLLFIDYEREAGKATATAALRVVHQPDLYITPRYVSITVTEGTHSSANITIIDYRKESLKILKIRPSCISIKANISESPSEYFPGWRHVIEAAYTDSPKETRRELQEQIFIETSDSEFPLLTIPVEVHRLDRLRLAPQNVLLQPGHPAEVILRDSLGQKVAIAECQTNGLVEPSFTKEEEPAKKIVLSLPRGNLDASKYPATIWIRVSKPCERRLPVRVSLAALKGT